MAVHRGQRIARNPNRIDLALSAAIVFSTEADIWRWAAWARWIVAVPIALTLLLWFRQSQTIDSLRLGFSRLVLSFTRWALLWMLTLALFLFLGWRLLFHLSILARGVVYFAWCVFQQVLYQSIVCEGLRRLVSPSWAAALVSGIVFALLHAPNPVLMPATFVWGALSCLLFENCRTVLRLALLQVMLSSMLMWSTPMRLNHAFRVGPAYQRMHVTR